MKCFTNKEKDSDLYTNDDKIDVIDKMNVEKNKMHIKIYSQKTGKTYRVFALPTDKL